MDVLSVALGISAAISAAGNAFLWAETRGTKARDKRSAEVDNRVQASVKPIEREVQGLGAKIDRIVEHQKDSIKIAIYESLEPVKVQLVELGTQITPLWNALIKSANESADVLHHPDPARAELDALIDHFRADTLTEEEEKKFRRFLNMIKNWEEGQDLGFPVYPTEPAAAANLLAMLDLVKRYRQYQKEGRQ